MGVRPPPHRAQITIRRLGAPLVATFLGCRLVAAVGVSGPLLGERVKGAWEWAGVLLVLGTVTWWAGGRRV